MQVGHGDHILESHDDRLKSQVFFMGARWPRRLLTPPPPPSGAFPLDRVTLPSARTGSMPAYTHAVYLVYNSCEVGPA